MSSIRFCTTPKSYLPHYFYIFRKPDPLGTDIKNVDFSSSGTMLYLETQKREKVVKVKKFNSVSEGLQCAWRE